jgi:hypothetical protein
VATVATVAAMEDEQSSSEALINSLKVYSFLKFENKNCFSSIKINKESKKMARNNQNRYLKKD